jgi:hypothetical protein
MPDLAWPDRRADVVAAQRRLADISPSDAGRWPDLANVVHWLVDDTSWDDRPSAQDIGLLLDDKAEAGAISVTVTALLEVLQDLGPVRPDEEYLHHARWPTVSAAAARAYDTLTRSTGQQPAQDG